AAQRKRWSVAGKPRGARLLKRATRRDGTSVAEYEGAWSKNGKHTTLLRLDFSQGNVECQLTAAVVGDSAKVRENLKRLRGLFDGWANSAVIGVADAAGKAR